jgi:protein TonB
LQNDYQMISKEEDEDIVDFASVEVMPEFPGGQSGWGKYLQENMKYPPLAREKNIKGRVIVSFVVKKNGDLSDIKVIKGIGWGCDEEAVRVLKTAPSWKPGIQNGRSVRVQYTMPIFFQLAN